MNRLFRLCGDFGKLILQFFECVNEMSFHNQENLPVIYSSVFLLCGLVKIC